MSKIKILYSDKNVTAVVKMPGYLSEEGGSMSVPLMLKEENDGEYHTVHRLDKEVGGVMVYANNKKSAAALTKQITGEGFEKEYVAVITGVMPESCGTLEDLLYHDRNRNKTYVVDRMRNGVKKAVLEYSVVATEEYNGGTVSLVRVRLITGRTHQIRVQFASRGHSLAGDGKYGGMKCEGGISLWSYRIDFTDPESGKKMRVTQAPYDKIGLFGLFAKQIERIEELKDI